MSWVLVVYVVVAYGGGVASLDIHTERFATELGCVTAGEFITSQGVRDTRARAYKCIRDDAPPTNP